MIQKEKNPYIFIEICLPRFFVFLFLLSYLLVSSVDTYFLHTSHIMCVHFKLIASVFGLILNLNCITRDTFINTNNLEDILRCLISNNISEGLYITAPNYSDIFLQLQRNVLKHMHDASLLKPIY